MYNEGCDWIWEFREKEQNLFAKVEVVIDDLYIKALLDKSLDDSDDSDNSDDSDDNCVASVTDSDDSNDE